MTALNAETREALRLAVDQELRRRIAEDDDVPPDPGHGSHTSYNRHGCRCQQCRDFMSRYVRERRSRNPERQRELWRAAHARSRARRQAVA